MQTVRLVKTRVNDWESKNDSPGKAERHTRIMESNMTRRNSMEESMTDYLQRMSQSGNDKK